jgi:hypothetical protein
MANADIVRQLRTLADWFESKPDLPQVPYIITFDVFLSSLDELREIARLVGKTEKGQSDTYFWLRSHIGNEGQRIDWTLYRQVVCTPRVVGHEEIPERVIPAYVKDIVEWDCASLFGEAGGPENG